MKKRSRPVTDINRGQYCGPVRTVISDLAGTTVDFGSCAPAGAFVEIFRRHGVEVTVAEARGPMGIHKRDHIQAMLELPRIAQRWQQVKGHTWTEADLEQIYAEFVPLQLEVLPEYGDVIDGVVEAVDELHERGIVVAANTGYNREMLEIVLEKAQEGGFVPDAALCAFDVPKGRPAPWMIFRLMEMLNVYPPQAVVKIGDTIADIEAGLNAGVWTVGVTKTGNLVGLTKDELDALTPEELQEKVEDATTKFAEAQAHYVIDSFAGLPAVITDIEKRLREASEIPVL
jgi:phosphonoacetaldehyde hydrolase